MLQKRTSLIALVIAVIMALVVGESAWYFSHRVDPALARRLVIPAQLGGLPLLLTPDTRSASAELAKDFAHKHPHHAFFDARYGSNMTIPFLALMVMRGSLQGEGDIRLAHSPYTDIGPVRCGGFGGLTICFRTSDRLSVSVVFEGSHPPGTDPPDYSAQMATWVQSVWQTEQR